jgi:phosphomannomutase
VSDLSCFKAYDVRGEIGVNIDEGIAYRIGRAVAQHFSAKSMVIGFDARKTSPAFAAAASQGARDAGADVINIGLVS